jgi:hypothetical protein
MSLLYNNINKKQERLYTDISTTANCYTNASPVRETSLKYLHPVFIWITNPLFKQKGWYFSYSTVDGIEQEWFNKSLQ